MRFTQTGRNLKCQTAPAWAVAFLMAMKTEIQSGFNVSSCLRLCLSGSVSLTRCSSGSGPKMGHRPMFNRSPPWPLGWYSSVQVPWWEAKCFIWVPGWRALRALPWMIALNTRRSSGLERDSESLAFALSLTLAQLRSLSRTDKWF